MNKSSLIKSCVLIMLLLLLFPNMGCKKSSSGEASVLPLPADSCVVVKTIDQHLIPGPGEAGYDPELARLADAYWTQFKVFNSKPFAMSLDGHIKGLAERQLMEDFFHNNPTGLSWDQFSALNGPTGQPVDPDDLFAAYGEVGDLGMFGGVAAAGEAWRYKVLRDYGGYSCAEIEEARGRMITIMDSLHIQTAITGRPGSVARGIRPIDIPNDASGWGVCALYPNGSTTIWPLVCDDQVLSDIDCCAASGQCCGIGELGKPLPINKNFEGQNVARWRNDASGEYPGWIWLDECSKDQLDGYLFALGAVWEVVKNDPGIPQELKNRLVEDARNIGDMLMTPAPETGLDLSIRDGDGRLSTHHDLNPRELEGVVLPENSLIQNGFNALMSLGMIKVIHFITGDEKFRAFYYEELLEKRHFDLAMLDTLNMTDMGFMTNYSNINMAFVAYYNAVRYEPDPVLRKRLADIVETELWDTGKNPRQVRVINASFFDFMYAGLRPEGVDLFEVDGGIRTLKEFPDPPYFNDRVLNCDPTELSNGICVSINGVEVLPLATWVNGSFEPVMDYHGGSGIADIPVPRRLRPPSNFEWRSNPFDVNGGCSSLGDGKCGQLDPGGDFLAAYWLGRMLVLSDTNEENVTPDPPLYTLPAAPVNLVGTPYSETQIHLTWTDASNNEKGFVIERRTAGGIAFKPLVQLPANTTEYDDIQVTQNASYEYRVQAFNNVGWSAYSNVASVTSPPAPALPPNPATDLAIVEISGPHKLVIGWTDNSDNEQGFRIIRNSVTVATVTANVVSYSDEGLASGATYDYQVVAFNSAGDAAPSNLLPVTTPVIPITAKSPLDGEMGVALDSVIQVEFSVPVTIPDIVLFTVNETFIKPDGTYAMRPIGGWLELDIGGTVATFTPDKTLSMDQLYVTIVAVNFPPPINFYSTYFTFNTLPSAGQVNLVDGINRAFLFDVFSAALIDPPELGVLLALAGNIAIVLGVAQVDDVGETFNFIGAISQNPPNQDLSSPTLLIQEKVDLSDNPDFSVPALGQPGFTLMIPMNNILVPFYDVIISGTFNGNYEYMAHATFHSLLDIGVIAKAINASAQDICGYAPDGCEGCPAEPSRVECLELTLSEIRAEELPDPVIPITAPTIEDTTGAGTNRIVQLGLFHPRSGAPLPTAATPITVTLSVVGGGDATFLETGTQTVDVVIGDTGLATVTLVDNSGDNSLEAVVTNPAPGACTIYLPAGNSCIPDPTLYETEVVVTKGKGSVSF